MDRRLVEQAQQGDADAFDALVRASADRCLGIAFRILRDLPLAEDAVQTAFVSVWRDLRSLRDPDRFEPWLQRTLTRACFEEARRSRRFSTDVRVLPSAADPSPDQVVTMIDRDRLERAIRRLAIEQRAVLVLHHYLGLTLPEVADRLEIPVGTAKSRLHYATQAMRAALEADARPGPSAQERPA